MEESNSKSDYQQGGLNESAIDNLEFGVELDALVAESIGVGVSWHEYETSPTSREAIPSVKALRERNEFVYSVGAGDLACDDQVPSFSEDLYAVQMISRTNWAWTINVDDEITKAILIIVDARDQGSIAVKAEATIDEGLGDPDRTEALAMSRAIAKWGIRYGYEVSDTTAHFIREALNE